MKYRNAIYNFENDLKNIYAKSNENKESYGYLKKQIKYDENKNNILAIRIL